MSPGRYTRRREQMDLTMNRKQLKTLCILAAVVAGSTSIRTAMAQLDETWTVSVNGQTVQVNSDGSFRIPNIPAPDQFGVSGPGSPPDFLSDDFLRVVGVSTAGGVILMSATIDHL